MSKTLLETILQLIIKSIDKISLRSWTKLTKVQITVLYLELLQDNKTSLGLFISSRFVIMFFHNSFL